MPIPNTGKPIQRTVDSHAAFMNDYMDELHAAFADRYPIERPLGAGGMATVYLARDLKHGREVAVKVLRPELTKTIGADRFVREIEIAARLNHPHILPLHDSGRIDDFLFYVMPRVDGESLRQRLVREPQFPLTDVLSIAREVADALSYAHANDIVHRDIKPENILIHAGHVVVADFGIARAMTLSTVEPLTRAGIAIGTPAYMSPEQVTGEVDIDFRSDIYSLGCVMYEMLAGKPPFTGPTPESICRQHMTSARPSVTAAQSIVPPGVADIIDTSLAKKPTDRYASTTLLVEDLSLQAALQTDPAAYTRQRTAARWKSVRNALGVIVTLTLLLTAVGLVLRRPSLDSRTIATHRQVTFVGNVVEAAVSPQGNFLAYTTDGPDGYDLKVQDIESGSVIPIAASVHPLVLPNWSPDGQQILVGGGAPGEYRLLVYPRLGGDPYSIPLTGGAFARWSVDGRQEFSWSLDTRAFSLYTIATDTETRVETADTTAWIRDMAQHPGGDDLAILHAARNSPTNSIWRVSVDSAQRFAGTPRGSASRVKADRYELLLEQDAPLFSLEWSPKGDALYYLVEAQSNFQFWKLPTSANSSARNQPTLLLSGLEFAGGGGRHLGPGASLLSLTEDGSRLYYVKGRTFANLWAVRARGERWGVEQFTTGTATNFSPSISPDGKWVAYKSTIAGLSNIFVAPSSGGPPRQLTHIDSISGYPVWSPDGKSLAFGVRRGGRSLVVTVNVNGTPRLKTFSATELSGNGTITWAPGNEILYQRPSLRNFHFLDPLTEMERPLLSPDSTELGYLLQIRYSTDQSKLAVYWNRRRSGTPPGLYVIPLDGGRHRRIGTDFDMSPVGWSDDGSTVFALSQDQRAVLAVPIDGGTPNTVASLPFEAHWVGATHRRQWFVFSASDAMGDVWSVENFDPGS